MKTKFIFGIVLASFLLHSCSADSTSTKKSEQVSRTTSVDPLKKEKMLTPDSLTFGHKTWRIDSVEDNDIIVARLYKNPTIEGFNFEKKGVLCEMKVRPTGVIENREIGRWKIENDSLFLSDKNGEDILSYGFKLDGSLLTLKLNRNLKLKSNKKRTLYLSKYLEEWDERVKGPKNN